MKRYDELFHHELANNAVAARLIVDIVSNSTLEKLNDYMLSLGSIPDLYDQETWENLQAFVKNKRVELKSRNVAT
jgi:hypothetical protein